MIKSLPILIVIGLFVLPSGRALKCYQCSSDLEGDCVEPKEEKIVECPSTPSTAVPSNNTTVEPPTSPEGSGAGGEGSGAGGEGSGAGGGGSDAGGVAGKITYEGIGVQIVSGDEDDVVEGANGGSAKNEKKGRVSRAIVHHFSTNQVYADGQPKMVCVKKTTNTTVTRGCAPDSGDCSEDKNCYKCDGDACNSATSVAMYTSMMFGLLAFVFMTR